MSKLKDLILFEDEHIIAINKPAHLASLHERHDSGQASVVSMVKDLNPDYKLCQLPKMMTLINQLPSNLNNAALKKNTTPL
jgi:23S rRNA-/tRNA-specific pseudouridylate synthase